MKRRINFYSVKCFQEAGCILIPTYHSTLLMSASFERCRKVIVILIGNEFLISYWEVIIRSPYWEVSDKIYKAREDTKLYD